MQSAAILINSSKVDITNKLYDAKGDAETEEEAMCVASREDQEDLSAFDERANESTICHEELRDDLRRHGVLTSTRKQT